jgi:hypothetical protein
VLTEGVPPHGGAVWAEVPGDRFRAAAGFLTANGAVDLLLLERRGAKDGGWGRPQSNGKPNHRPGMRVAAQASAMRASGSSVG